MSFGNEIRVRRALLGMTQKELAEKIGVGQTMISGYEKDANKPDFDGLVGLSKVFGCTIDDLVNEKLQNSFRSGNT